MDRGLFFCAFAAFLLFFTCLAWAGENTAPVIRSVQASPGTAGENSPVALRVSAYDPEGDELEIEWDFGDGEKGKGIETEHFYSLGGEKEKEFTITAKATDPSGLSAKKTKIVSVKESDYFVEIVAPKEKPGKGRAFTLEIEVWEREGEKVDGAGGAALEIGGEKIPLEEKNGVLSGEIIPEHGFGNSQAAFVSFKVAEKYQLKENRMRFFIPFKASEISASSPFEGMELFPGRLIESIETSLDLPGGTAVETGSFYAEIPPAGKNKMSWNGENFSAEVDYLVKESDAQSGLSIRLSGTDKHGNELEKEFTARVLPSGGPFSISTEPVFSAFEELNYGQRIPLRVVVEPRGKISGLEIVFSIPELGYLMELEEGGENAFEGIVEVPGGSGEKKVETRLKASAVSGGEQSSQVLTAKTALSGKLKAEIGLPEKTMRPITELAVIAAHANGLPLEAGGFKATLEIDGERLVADFKKTGENTYTAKLEEPVEAGKHSISVNFSIGMLSGSDSIEFEVVQGQNSLLWLAVIGLAAFLGFFVLRVFKRIKKAGAFPERKKTRVKELTFPEKEKEAEKIREQLKKDLGKRDEKEKKPGILPIKTGKKEAGKKAKKPKIRVIEQGKESKPEIRRKPKIRVVEDTKKKKEKPKESSLEVYDVEKLPDGGRIERIRLKEKKKKG